MEEKLLRIFKVESLEPKGKKVREVYTFRGMRGKLL